MSSFHNAITGALDALRDTTAVTVRFHRGSSATAVLQAIPGLSHFKVQDDNGMIVRYHSRDFIVKASDLELDGETVTPKRGDRFKEESGTGELLVHEVMREDGGEEVWRYSDLGRTYVRIHTKLICRETGELGS
jgi:hypothetical protein